MFVVVNFSLPFWLEFLLAFQTYLQIFVIPNLLKEIYLYLLMNVLRINVILLVCTVMCVSKRPPGCGPILHSGHREASVSLDQTHNEQHLAQPNFN